MKFLVDFFPIILFFVAYKLGNIYVATGVAMLASLLQVIGSRYTQGRFEKLPLITLLTLMILGGATLLFRNELFIKWKPTALYWLLALFFLATHLIGNKPLIQRLIEQNIQLPQKVWYRLNLSWVIFFTALGFANLYVIYHFDTNTWVNFKLFGTLGLSFVFIIFQGLYMAKYHKLIPAKKE